MSKTKIICTIGPASNKMDCILKLIDAGMNVARINFSHGSHDQHRETIATLKEARRQADVPLGILLDTKGPELRIGRVADEGINVVEGQRVELVKEASPDNPHAIEITPAFVIDEIPLHATILINDGYIESEVVDKTDGGLVIEIKTPGKITSNKGVNVPDCPISLPAVTDKDIADIKFGCENDVDMIAASFIRSADHILEIKKLLDNEGHPEIQVHAKIENSEGVKNFDGILQVADGIMIARGDLGVEVPLSQVPRLQKMMIRNSYLAGKPSITATQMLESMITNPRPTRAETSDVANAIYDSTSAVMLSGETAVGKYPVEAVKTMKSVIEETESDFDHRAFFDHHAAIVYHDVPSSVTLATVKTSYSSHAKAIFAFTTSGSTARLLSRLRPEMPVIALTPNKKNYHQMALNWGVIPIYWPPCNSVEEAFATVSKFALEKGYVANGDLVVVTAGSPFGISGTTNMMIVESIGDVLVRAHEGSGGKTHGKATVLLSPEAKKAYEIKDRIIVLSECDERYLPLIREANGLVLQNHIDDTESESYAMTIAKTLQLPCLIRADAACHIIKEGQLVTLDPKRALVYKGVVL